MEDGIILIDKPSGWTSFDVVAKIRGQIRREYLEKGIKPTKRQLKVGHAGTLDPFATGLLIILLGEATKRADEFLKLNKTYEATIHLGEVSSTGDPEGEIRTVDSGRSTIDKPEVEVALRKFIGQIEQTPPAFSAIKVNGQRAYKLARRGEVVKIPRREVTIHSIELIDYSYPELKIRTQVSSGTYIRTLAEDIGAELKVGAYCSMLRRTQIAGWDVKDSDRRFPLTQ